MSSGAPVFPCSKREFYLGKVVSALICAHPDSTLARLVEEHSKNADIGRAVTLVAGWIVDAMIAESEKIAEADFDAMLQSLKGGAA